MSATDPDRCPSCGSTILVESLRDPAPTGGTIPPSETFGHWVECQTCGHEYEYERPTIEEKGEAK